MTWPTVVGEVATLDKLLEGCSISRFGDGELKIMDDAGYVREPKNAELSKQLRVAFHSQVEKHLIGIPTFAPTGPKYEHWIRHEKRFAKHIAERRTYYSAFISRPDSAPWINVQEYALKMQQLWKGKMVAVVCEDEGSALRAVRYGAGAIVKITCPQYEAFKHIDQYEDEIHAFKPDLAILSCGPTASILAHRLAWSGIQAIDFGSGGSFIAKLLK